MGVTSHHQDIRTNANRKGRTSIPRSPPSFGIHGDTHRRHSNGVLRFTIAGEERCASLNLTRIAGVALLVVSVAGCGTAVSRSGSPHAQHKAPVRFAPAAMTNVIMTSAKNGWAVSLSDVWHTDNAGATWLRITPKELDSYTHFTLAITGDHRVWVAGSSPTRRPNGTAKICGEQELGGKWSCSSFPLYEFPESPLYVQNLTFADPSHGWVLARQYARDFIAGGHLWATSDGGTHWTKVGHVVRSGASEFTSARQGWHLVVGDPLSWDATGLYVTDDGGVSWHTYNVAPGAKVISLPVFAGQQGLIATQAGASHVTLLFTSDGGQTWKATAPVNVPAPTVYLQNPSSAFLWTVEVGGPKDPGGPAALEDILYITHDAGRTWQRIQMRGRTLQRLLREGYGISKIQFLRDDRVGFMLVNSLVFSPQTGSIVLVTDNGGLTWQQQ